MKTSSRSVYPIVFLIASWLSLFGNVHAQVETVLHSSSDGTVANDAATPTSLLKGADGNFYYVTSGGGVNGYGAIFSITPQGTVSLFYSFDSANNFYQPTSLIQASDGTFYGTTSNQIFKVTSSGQGSLLYTSSGTTLNGLIQGADSNFYGTTYSGGTKGYGTVFKMTPQGAVTILHNFGDGSVLNDGSYPNGRLVQGTDGNLYGNTGYGGSSGDGTIFKITPAGAETILHNFGDGTVANDGYTPHGALVQGTDGNFYGVTEGNGGSSGETIFKITSGGTETVLHTFGNGSTLNDGAGPNGGLIQGSDGNFYGTTTSGGGTSNNNTGTVFEMTPQGTVTILHSFDDGSVTNDGAGPNLGLVKGSGGIFYGTTSAGGEAGSGTIYAFDIAEFLLTSPTSEVSSVSLPFSYQVTAAETATTYAASNLPTGLSINSTTGLISGTPTAIGSKTVTITVTNSDGSTSIPITINVAALSTPVITSMLTSYGAVGAAFSYATIATNLPTSYSATGLTGTGLAINPATGVISGTPTTAGTYPVTLTATNSAGTSGAETLSIQIAASPVLLSQETILHRLGDGSVANDGSGPESLFQGFDGNFYYVTTSGGTYGNGAVFRATPQGSVSLVYSFNSYSDLYSPTSLMQGADGNFYGTTSYQIFELTSTGQLSLLHSFGTGSTLNRLVQGTDGNFYGSDSRGGTKSQGTVFKMTPQGTVTILHNFGDGSVLNDGTTPYASLVQGTDGNFYGGTHYGGSSGYGTVYKITPAGTETILHNFGDGTVANDGSYPGDALVRGTDGNFYGATGSNGNGVPQTIFKITPGGTETVLHVFGNGSTLNDGAAPNGGLIQGSDGNFYGTTVNGGGTSNSSGAVFEMTPQGTVTILHSFGDGSVAVDGVTPYYGLVQGKDGNFYGTTSSGGDANNGGTIYVISPGAFFLTSATSVTGAVSSPFTYHVVATDPVTGYAATNLPAGLSISSTTGLITGTPTTVQTKAVTLTLTTIGGSASFPLTIAISAAPKPAVTSVLTSYGSVGVAFSYSTIATNLPTSYSATGLASTGLSIISATGVISGTPTTAGIYPVTLTATNSAGNSSGVTLSIQISDAPVVLSQETILHRLGDGSVANDGSGPESLFQGFDGNFYYVTTSGGTDGYGAIFKATPEGTVSLVYSFSSYSDVYSPTSLMQGADGNFYGTTTNQIFELTSTGQLSLLHAFGSGSKLSGLIQGSDGNFYGTDSGGGTKSQGTVFKMTPQGTVTILHNFGNGSVLNDGATPYASLVQGTDGNFYGDTYYGGSTGSGTVFKITPGGAVTILHNFGDGTVANDGGYPLGALVEGTDGNFYGVTVRSDIGSRQTIFKITPAGTETVLHVFGDGSTLNDGAVASGSLIQGSDGNFYGTTEYRGGTSSGSGSVFEMTPQGTVTILHSFQDGSVADDGANPLDGLIQGKDGNFYGTTSSGGASSNGGIVFSIGPATPALLSANTATGSTSLFFTYQVSATTMATSYAATNLPAGLSINSITGLISGIPTATGTFDATLTLTNAGGSSSYGLTITVETLQAPEITSLLTSYGAVGVTFSYATVATNRPTMYSATGLDSTGLSINSVTGLITGVPTTAGTYPVTLTATNSAGASEPVFLDIQIADSPVVLSQETILHRMGDGSVANDGASPASLIQGFDGNFYYVTTSGGTDGYGAIFKATPQGTVALFYSFSYQSEVYSPTTLMQGADGNFYGTTTYQIFELTSTGQLILLHAFGGNPSLNQLIQGSDGNFYGVDSTGGTQGQGMVFKMTPQGAVTILHTFGDGSVLNDGVTPDAGLVQGSDGNFYGDTSRGGSTGNGTVFKITPGGTETILHNFGAVTNDGQYPRGALVEGTDGDFYGTTTTGSSNEATVFKITPQGNETILHTFGDGSTLNDGTVANGGLIQGSDGNFYGTTQNGGGTGNSYGAVFEMTPLGTVTILHSFNDGSVADDGSSPSYGLVQGANGNFYGTTAGGGIPTQPSGTIYVISTDAPFLTSPVAARGSVSLPFSYQVTATNTPTNYSATNLPAGLSINSITGRISGTPTTVQTNTVTLSLSNASGSSSFALTIAVGALQPPAVTSILVAYGSVGTAFTYSTTATNLPSSFGATGLAATGLSIASATGIISGTPTTAGTYPVTLTASNSAGTSQTATLSIKISASSVTLSQEYNISHRLLDGTVAGDGSNPQSLIQAFDGNLYYVTAGGGSSGNGAVFQETIQGGVSLFYSFNSTSDLYSPTSLIQGADGNFYGTTAYQIFRLNPLGQISILHSFGNGARLNPLVQGADGNFYGTTYTGQTTNGVYSATGGFGTAFKITPQGVVTFLHNFGDGTVLNDGFGPQGPLIQATDGNFYGTTSSGGGPNSGTVFKMTPQGTVTVLHSFQDGSVTNDGQVPNSGVIQGTDGNFYGTTSQGGNPGPGTVFKMTPSGQVTILHNFPDSSVPNDGSNPEAGLIQGYDGNFYGTTYSGGSAGTGTLFQITPQGTETIIHSFGDVGVTDDGTYPLSGVIQGADGNFYGMTSNGGDTNNGGTIYDVAAAQQPTHVPIFIGAAYGSGPILNPFSFTPKVLFGVSGSGTANGASVGASGNGFMAALVSWVPKSLLPQAITKAFVVTDWTLQGNLPSYLNFDSTTGTISGTPTVGGTYTVVMTPHNAINTGTATTVTIYINVPPGIQSRLAATGTVGQAFSYQIQAIPAPNYYGAAQLPDWLSADPITGIISGTPPAAGTYVFDALATNDSGQTTAPVSLSVTGGVSNVPAITSSSTASGEEGTPFFYETTAHPGATSFSAMDLPSGLQFDETNGVLSGIPVEAGTFLIPITATNASGSYSSVVTLTLAGPIQPGIAGSLALTVLQGATFSYQIPATGIPSSYSATGLPTGVSIDSSTGIISGTSSTIGTSPIALTVANGVGVATSTLSLNVVAPSNFGAWETAYKFNGAMADTPQGDGVPNLLKYVYDIDPMESMTANARAALPTLGTATANGNNYLTLTYRRYAALSNVTVNVEASSDLKTWTIVNPPDLSQQIGTDPITGDPVMQVGVQTNGTTNHFIRLDVTSP